MHLQIVHYYNIIQYRTKTVDSENSVERFKSGLTPPPSKRTNGLTDRLTDGRVKNVIHLATWFRG